MFFKLFAEPLKAFDLPDVEVGVITLYLRNSFAQSQNTWPRLLCCMPSVLHEPIRNRFKLARRCQQKGHPAVMEILKGDHGVKELPPKCQCSSGHNIVFRQDVQCMAVRKLPLFSAVEQ